jgi:hypothetical protein
MDQLQDPPLTERVYLRIRKGAILGATGQTRADQDFPPVRSGEKTWVVPIL